MWIQMFIKLILYSIHEVDAILALQGLCWPQGYKVIRWSGNICQVYLSLIDDVIDNVNNDVIAMNHAHEVKKKG